MGATAPVAGDAALLTPARDDRVALPAAIRIGVPAAIVALAAALRLIDLASISPNPYYDSAVRTMSLSWHNFFYGVFAPDSGLAIDKPPVDLWLQVASTKLLGFTTPALLLPEALAGTLSVLLLFDLLRTLFGWAAAVAGALALAVLPIAVITARSDTMDSVMGALILGSAVLIARVGANPDGRRGRLLLAAALFGLAFEVKILEAVIALPALLVLYWLSSAERPAVRLRRLLSMTAVFLVVALSWLTATSLAPSSARPWYIGSTNGSPWNATFVFNGVDRLLGPPAHAVPRPTSGLLVRSPKTLRDRAAARRRVRRNHRAALLRRPAAAGPTRLFARNASLGVRIGIELAAAWLALGLALALGSWRRLDRLGRAGIVTLGGWLAIGTILFSVMRRLQPRYFEAFTPAVAGSLGAGLVLAAQTAGARWGNRRAWSLGAGAALALVLAVPLGTSIGAVADGSTDSGSPGGMAAGRVASLSAYLRAHQGGAHYQFASLSAAKAGPIVVRDGRPVMILTSLYGRPLVSVQRLAAAVRAGQVRYALAGANCTPASGDRLAGCSAQAAWLRVHGTDVSRAAGQPNRGLVYRLRP
jgi:4-amino-4-deoxy-L-arabinose transferase-like glycosyltransferase